MQRIGDTFVAELERTIGLAERRVLEIGCGDGRYATEFVRHNPRMFFGVDPNELSVMRAKSRGIPNARFEIGSAENLPFGSGVFDTVVFTLSLHHVAIPKMEAAINQAIRVSLPGARIVFLEPGFDGTFFEAEIAYGTSDGDERLAKHAARRAIYKHKLLLLDKEWNDDIEFQFESNQDFVSSMTPKRNMSDAIMFVQKHDFKLRARRNIAVFSVR